MSGAVSGRGLASLTVSLGALGALVCLMLPAEWVLPGKGRSPVILVPGLGGSQVEGRLTGKARVPSLLCHRGASAQWFALWLNMEPLLTPWRFNCWADNVRLEWRALEEEGQGRVAVTPEAKEQQDWEWRAPAGVEVRVPFGSTKSVERVDANAHKLDWLVKHSLPADLEEPLHWLSPFRTLVQRLVDELGYARDQNILAAPYDFRISPGSNSEWQQRMKGLIESTYEAQGGKPVTLVCHSLGGLYTWHFLHQQRNNWIAKYILRVVFVAVPFAGTPRALSMVLSGDDFDLPMVLPLAMRRVQRTFQSPFVLLPSKHVWGNTTLVSTPQRNYTAFEYEALIEEAYQQAMDTASSQTGPRASASPPDEAGGAWDENGVLVDGGNAPGDSGQHVAQDDATDEAPPNPEVYAARAMRYHLQTLENFTADLQAKGAPRVPVLCMYSHGLDTPVRLEYSHASGSVNSAADANSVTPTPAHPPTPPDSSRETVQTNAAAGTGTTSNRIFDLPPKVVMGDGDGTASVKSTSLCEEWHRRLGSRLRVIPFRNVSHFNMIREKAVTDAIIEQLQLDMMAHCSDQHCSMEDFWSHEQWMWLYLRQRWGWVPQHQLARLQRVLSSFWTWWQSGEEAADTAPLLVDDRDQEEDGGRLSPSADDVPSPPQDDAEGNPAAPRGG
uniref:Uncharacterized protein n=1 Tax=Rhizochromulina marina TaxID=1034831 RepID=A0A7S2SIY1_9STRA